MFFPWANSVGSVIGLCSGTAVSFWIAIGNFMSKPFYPKAPVSIDGCRDLYHNITNLSELPSIDHNSDQEIFPLYKVSYMWYSVIGCLLTVIVGLVCSFITGGKNINKLDSRLLSPLALSVYQSLPSKIRPKFNTSIQTKEEEAKSSMEHEKANADFPNGITNIAYVPSQANFELQKVNTSL